MYAYKPKTRVAVQVVGTEPNKPLYALGTITQRRNGAYFVLTDAGATLKATEVELTLVSTNRQIKRNLTQVELQGLLLKSGTVNVKPASQQDGLGAYSAQFVKQGSHKTTSTRFKRESVVKDDDLIARFKRQLSVYQTTDAPDKTVIDKAMNIVADLRNFNRQGDADRAKNLNALKAFMAGKDYEKLLLAVARAQVERTVLARKQRQVPVQTSDGAKFTLNTYTWLQGDLRDLRAWVVVELSRKDFSALTEADARVMVPSICGSIRNQLATQAGRLTDACQATLNLSLFESFPVVQPLENKDAVAIGLMYILSDQLSAKV